MMKNKHAGDVLRYLDDFKAAGLSMCAQVVLCRGVNDGERLERTLRDLAQYYPALTSVAVVPAGLTKHREGLYPLSDFTAEEAASVIDMIDKAAERELSLHGGRLFFAADELYLKAGLPIPADEYYEDYPQLENGVGMMRSFLTESGMAVGDIEELGDKVKGERTVTVVTGAAAYNMIVSVARDIERVCPRVHVKVEKIINRFYGESITVTGLLTGKDIYEQLRDSELGCEVLIPENCLRYPEEDFLCGMTRSELEDRLGVPVRIGSSDGYRLVEDILGLS
jgi:putative radical SAM enzyme (TIGR03279 family)